MLDWEWEPAKLVKDDNGVIIEAKVYRDGQWVDANPADLFCKGYITSPKVFESMLERRGGK